MNRNTSKKNNIGLSNLQIQTGLLYKEEEGAFDFEEIKKQFEKKLKEKHSKEVKLENKFNMTI